MARQLVPLAQGKLRWPESHGPRQFDSHVEVNSSRCVCLLEHRQLLGHIGALVLARPPPPPHCATGFPQASRTHVPSSSLVNSDTSRKPCSCCAAGKTWRPRPNTLSASSPALHPGRQPTLPCMRQAPPPQQQLALHRMRSQRRTATMTLTKMPRMSSSQNHLRVHHRSARHCGVAALPGRLEPRGHRPPPFHAVGRP